MSDNDKQIALELLRTEIKITKMRLSDARYHENGLRKLHSEAKSLVCMLNSIMRDLQSRADSISPPQQ